VERNPHGPAAVVTAIVMALGWTLANASLIASFKHSWLGWVHDYYHSDLIVSAGGRVTDILTAPPFAADVTDEIRAMPGVTAAQGLRRVEIEFRGTPTLLLSFDEAPSGLPVLDRDWASIAPAFWAGQGALVSDTLAHRTGLGPGDRLTLNSPTGAVSLPVLASFRDVYGADLGAIAISRRLYSASWQDPLIDRIRVWAPEAKHPVEQAVNERYARTRGIQALTYEATMAAIIALIEGAFTITSALVFVCLAVSTMGVLNFLLTSVLDRQREFVTMRAVGMTPRQITASVSAEGGLIGFTGVVVGLVAGAVVSAVVVLRCVPMVNGWHFAYRFPADTAAAVSVAALLATMLIGILPGWMAARATPKALQGE
jgi:putative ABC transport system permease protein